MSAIRFILLLLPVLLWQAANALATSPVSSSIPGGKTASAIFAGGCFWSVEADFEKLPGILAAESGYTGGKTVNPTYRQVVAGGTGHAEAVRVTYDPDRISYAALLDHFWRHIDPSAKDAQFCDYGPQYRTAIFFQNEEQRTAAEATKAALEKSGRFYRVHTQIVPAARFYPAEAYHQDYARKNPSKYRYYKIGCKRDQRLARIWEDKR
jgi:peptide-methionine (S)-S-oxide reductase